jgi:hypothetical protein
MAQVRTRVADLVYPTVKVFYTFDEQSKVNCLARWPHLVNVQTVKLDEATCIGVIELKICLQAVVTSR